MSAATEYRAAVEHILRDDYRVDDLAFSTGGRHPRCTFVYRDRRVNATLHRVAGDAAKENNLLAIKLQDIRRLLGDPPPKPNGREKRTLTQMTEELHTRAAPLLACAEIAGVPIAAGQEADHRYTGHLARYAGRAPRLRFKLPPAAAAEWDNEGGCFTVTRLASRSWVLCRAAAGKARCKDGTVNCMDPAAWTGLPPFGQTKAEYLCDGDAVLCTLRDGDLAPIDAHRSHGARKPRAAPPVPTTPEPPQPPPPAVRPTHAPPAAPAAVPTPRPPTAAGLAAKARACLASSAPIELEEP